LTTSALSLFVLFIGPRTSPGPSQRATKSQN